MKRTNSYIVLVMILVSLFSTNLFSQDAPTEVITLTKNKLLKYGKSKEIISAVKAQNAKNNPLSKLKEIDKKWKETSGLDDFMKDMLANGCSSYLKNIRQSEPCIVEAFVMDSQGANVGITNKTSNYWRGDKDKFTKCYNNGNGTIYYGKVSFDESCQTYVIQVSVPVIDNGKTIGTVTFGIDVNKIKH